ncbi:hypothetical protein [Kitasatospora sp. GAS1066B]|uniref:hypothetical protein n=1 Tax=Kitasatospora sp. GAS1066B TaxID=3156271 RepID=UPI003516BB37
MDYVFSTTSTDRTLRPTPRRSTPFGQIVAIDDFDLDIGALKPKSASFHWEFMLPAPGPAHAAPHPQPDSRLVDAGILTTTATRDLGTINAANLREAHRIQ